MRFAFVAAALLGLAACATPCPPPAGPIEPKVARYICRDSTETFTATFFYNPDHVRVEQPGYPTVDLPVALAGSGFRYMADGVELRGRNDEARLSRPGGGEVLCYETRN
ncbi:MAG: MliC family protein [Caulobacterales bacterium]